MTMESRREFTRRSDRIEELVQRLESGGDPAMRAVAQELVQAVIELHGAAFDRVLNVVGQRPGADEVLAHIAEDELVSSVLSLHGIHPVALEKRVAGAIEKTRPYLQSHGGGVEVISIENGIVQLKLEGSCGSCSSSAETLKHVVENAIYDAAPEIEDVRAEVTRHSGSEVLVTLETR